MDPSVGSFRFFSMLEAIFLTETDLELVVVAAVLFFVEAMGNLSDY